VGELSCIYTIRLNAAAVQFLKKPVTNHKVDQTFAGVCHPQPKFFVGVWASTTPTVAVPLECVTWCFHMIIENRRITLICVSGFRATTELSSRLQYVTQLLLLCSGDVIGPNGEYITQSFVQC